MLVVCAWGPQSRQPMSAAEVLAQHRYGLASCDGCAKSYPRPAKHAAHQLDALKAAGYRVLLSDDVDRAAQVLDLYLADRCDGDLPVADVYERFTTADAAEVSS